MAARQALRLARPAWWRRPPFLPVPDRAYLAFRLETQYGDAPPDAADLVEYLEWCLSGGGVPGSTRSAARRRR